MQMLCLKMATVPAVENAAVEILQTIHDIIRGVEREVTDINQRRDAVQETFQKLQELRAKFQQCRDLINKLPGISLTKEEQLQQIANLRRQVVRKQELLTKYKGMCQFDIPDVKLAH